MRPQVRRRSLLLWFGVLGPPVAWTVQHVAGYGLTEADCNAAGVRWDLPVGAWTIAVTTAAAGVVVLAEAASVATWRATRGAGSEAPAPREHFLSVMGMTLGPLFLLIILMSGLGSLFLAECRQG